MPVSTGPFGRVAAVQADPLEDGAGQLIPITGGGQQLLFRVVEMKPVSTSTEGMSGAFSTARLACSGPSCATGPPGPWSAGSGGSPHSLRPWTCPWRDRGRSAPDRGIGIGFGQYLADPNSSPCFSLLLQPAAHLAVGAVGRQPRRTRGSSCRSCRRGPIPADPALALGGQSPDRLFRSTGVVATTGQHGTHAGLVGR